MKEGRIPAQSIFTVLRPVKTLCGVHNNVENDTADKANNQPSSNKNSGNRCGFEKKKYRMPIFRSDNKRRPHVLEEAKRRVFESLHDIYKYPDFLEMFYHAATKEKRGRKRRQERLESCCSLMLISLLHRVNLYTMQVGKLNNRNEFINDDFGIVKSDTNMSDSRLTRASRLLQEMGFIEVKVIVEQLDDGYRTEKVIIKLTDKLFKIFGLEEELWKNRKDVHEKFLDKQERLDRNRAKLERYRPTSKLPIDIQQQLATLTQQKRINQKSTRAEQAIKKSYNAVATPAQNKRVIALAMSLKEKNPHITFKEAVDIADRQIQLYEH